MKNQKITAIITTYNEATNIQDCISSLLLLTDSILVIDTESTDNTVKIAKSLGVKVISTKRCYFVEPVRQFSIEQVSNGWIIILDADERMTPKLAEEIKNVIQVDNSDAPVYYRIPRKNMYASVKWLQHGGWYPDHQLRLFRKDAFIEWPKSIHSTPRFTGRGAYLTQPFLHFIHPSLESMVDKSITFEDKESNLLFKADRPVSVAQFFRKFLGELYRRLIKNSGYLDGTVGIIESIYQAYSKTITYLYLYEKKKSSTVRSVS